MSTPYHIIEGLPAHRNFVKSTWLKSFFGNKSHLVENIQPEVYYHEHAKLVDKAMEKTRCLMAMSNDAPDVAVGYMIFSLPDVIHYVYVRHAFKNFGIAKTLLLASGIDKDKFTYTHRTRDCAWAIGFTKKSMTKSGEFVREFIPGKLPKAIYNPYIFLKGL